MSDGKRFTLYYAGKEFELDESNANDLVDKLGDGTKPVVIDMRIVPENRILYVQAGPGVSIVLEEKKAPPRPPQVRSH